mmetsp:Transcript_5941/g.14757  ORF Transcript_5941/g.14757 Transcript_5941/m.14757 type:complete len:89 (-) Transcript_5941:203-469(-)
MAQTLTTTPTSTTTALETSEIGSIDSNAKQDSLPYCTVISVSFFRHSSSEKRANRSKHYYGNENMQVTTNAHDLRRFARSADIHNCFH